MPERRFDALNQENREQAINYEPGYDWIPGRFGPPPGIPRAKKEQFDRMSDVEYFSAFMRLCQEAKESLMISEAERRRTFTAHWPIWNIVDGYACAKEGLYYTGRSDTVQCAFCAGRIRNWERGDTPQQLHKNFFSYCKMAQRKPCHNIPYSTSELPDELRTQITAQQQPSNRPALNLEDLGISNCRPKHPQYSVLTTRMETFARYNQTNTVSADDLCNAGFFYQGPGDTVRCFWCDGSLEGWERGDNPWEEHAKWYPGCNFVRQSKGIDFIKHARSLMSEEDLQHSNELAYNHGDLSFLNQEENTVVPIEDLDSFKLCVSLGFDESLIKQAFELNEGNDFENIQSLLDVLYALEDKDETQLEEILHRNKEMSENKLHAPHHSTETETGGVERPKFLDVAELVRNPEDPTLEESEDIVSSMTCHHCHEDIIGAVVLPCGHFCLCQRCSRRNLPIKCPQCGGTVRGACRTYLS